MKGAPTNREAAGLIAGFALWSLGFAGSYGLHGLFCGADMTGGHGGARMMLLGLYGLILMAEAGLIVWMLRRWRAAPRALHFVRGASLALAVAALVTTLWTGIPVLSLRLC